MKFRSGAGRLCLDFTRTLRHRGSPGAVDELATPAALAAWITQLGPVPATAAQVHQDAGPLREAVYALVTGAKADLDLINTAAAAPTPAPALGPGGLRWHAADPVTATLALIARDALDLVTAPLAARVRECANPECAALFVDNSRPGNRRWCAMGSCGNRAKKDAYRERHAT